MCSYKLWRGHGKPELHIKSHLLVSMKVLLCAQPYVKQGEQDRSHVIFMGDSCIKPITSSKRQQQLRKQQPFTKRKARLVAEKNQEHTHLLSSSSVPGTSMYRTTYSYSNTTQEFLIPVFTGEKTAPEKLDRSHGP